MELLLGLPPMTQYDASAMPLYNSFGTKTDLTPYQVVAPKIEVNEKNTQLAWGAKESMEMNLDDVDQAPMFALNEILWKSAKGPGCADALASSPVLVPKAVGLSSGVRLTVCRACDGCCFASRRARWPAALPRYALSTLRAIWRSIRTCREFGAKPMARTISALRVWRRVRIIGATASGMQRRVREYLAPAH